MAKTGLFELQCGSMKVRVASPANGAMRTMRNRNGITQKVSKAEDLGAVTYNPEVCSQLACVACNSTKEGPKFAG